MEDPIRIYPDANCWLCNHRVIQTRKRSHEFERTLLIPYEPQWIHKRCLRLKRRREHLENAAKTIQQKLLDLEFTVFLLRYGQQMDVI